MKRTYEVWAGQQYDPQGTTIKFGRHGYAFYTGEGKFDCGDPLPPNDKAEVEAVVMRVIETRQDETITLGQSESVDRDLVERMDRLHVRMREWERTDI